MKLKIDFKTFVLDTAYSVAGSVLYALGLYTFALGAGFATGGVSGISLIVNHYTGWPIGTIGLVINIPLILFSLRTLGTTFVLRTGWTLFINTLFLDFVFPLFPTYAQNANFNPLLAAIFTGISLGAGLALIYMRGSSTGGVDFITMTIKKKKPHYSVGQINLVMDAVVIAAGGFVFGNVDAVLYGIVTSFAATMMMDNILYGAGSSKMAIIFTNFGMEISEAISNEVERGSTLIPATGTYTGEKRDVLLCVCSKNEIYKVRTAARAVDSTCMVIVTEASEVVGEGFVPPKLPGNDEG